MSLRAIFLLLLVFFAGFLLGQVRKREAIRSAVSLAYEATDSCASDTCLETYSLLIGRDVEAK